MKTIIFTSLEPAFEAELDTWYAKLILSDPEYSHVTHWAVADYTLVMMDGDQWASAIELFNQTIRVNGEPVAVCGVSGVMTHPDYQGRGLSSQLMQQALKLMQEKFDPPFAVLDCRKPLIPFYTRLGFKHVPGRIRYQQPDGEKMFDPARVNIMVNPLKGIAWKNGDIDLDGLPW